MSRRLKTILLLCSLGVVLKLVLLIFAIDEFYGCEELARGLIAHEILNGPAYPIFNYQVDNYSGGSLVMGLLAVPFFAVFGDSLFALKLTTLIFPLLTAIFIYLILSRYVDEHAAVLAVILVFLAPHSYTRLSLVAWGDHPQIPALMAAVFFLLYEATFGCRRSPLFMILFGVICGFGLYFSYHFIAPLTLCILFVFAWDRKFFSRPPSFIYFISGFIVGFSPWIYYNVSHDFQGLTITSYGSTFEIVKSINLFKIFRRLFQLATTVPGYSLGTNLVISTRQRMVPLSYYLVFLVSLATLIRKNRAGLASFFNSFIHPRRVDKKLHSNWQQIPFLIYLPIFMLFVAITPYSLKNYPPYFADRYLTTLHTCMFVIIAICVVTWWRSQGLRRLLSVAMAGVVILNGAFTQVGIVWRGINNHGIRGSFMKGVGRRGYTYGYIMDDRIAYAWYRGNISKNLDVIVGSGNLQRRRFLSEALGRSLAYRAGEELSSVVEILAQTNFPDKDVENLIYQGLGYGRGRWYSNYLERDLMLAKELPWFEHFLIGLVESVGYWFNKDTAQVVRFIEELVPESFKEKFFYRLGDAIAEKRKGVLSHCLEEVAENIPPRYLGAAYEGMGREVRGRFVGDINQRNKAARLIQENVPFEYQESLIQVIFGSEDKLQNLEKVYKQTLVDLIKSEMPESKLNPKQITEDFIKSYKRYKRKFRTDKDKIIDAELKLAKILLLSGRVNKALNIFSNAALKEDIMLKDKLYALYYIGKIKLLYLSNAEDAAPIFRRIVDDYEKEYSAETAWAVLWSMFRLAETYEMEGKSKKASGYFDRVINNKNSKKLKIDDRVFICASIAEKYLLSGQVQKSLEIVEENLKICNEFKGIDFDWAFDWLTWIKMRIANRYYQGDDSKKAKRLYEELIDRGFFRDTNRLKTRFFYNLVYNPKPFVVDKKKMIGDLKITVEVLSKYFPKMEDQIKILKEFKIDY